MPRICGASPIVEVHGDADHLGRGVHQLFGRFAQSCEVCDARALDDERDEHADGVALAYLAEVDRARAPRPAGSKGAAVPPAGFGRGDPCAEMRRDALEDRGENTARRDVDDLVAAALGEEAELGLRAPTMSFARVR